MIPIGAVAYLTLDADQLVRDASDAHLDGRAPAARLADVAAPIDCVYASRNSQYRIQAGRVLEASDRSVVGAELVAWLVEESGRPTLESRWRPSARAVLVERSERQVVVTSRTLTRSVVAGEPPVAKPQRRASVIPKAPPIPTLRPAPLHDASPTPIRIPDEARRAALDLTSTDERPTHRPPSGEESLYVGDAALTPARLPNVRPPARRPSQPRLVPPAVANAPRSTPTKGTPDVVAGKPSSRRGQRG